MLTTTNQAFVRIANEIVSGAFSGTTLTDYIIIEAWEAIQMPIGRLHSLLK